jgi:putative addiction module component (TIGR02574 family)
MSTDVAELFVQASTLSENERATLAGLLIESLETERDTDVEEAWADEIQRRIADLDSGAVQTVSWDSVKSKLLRHLDGL